MYLEKPQSSYFENLFLVFRHFVMLIFRAPVLIDQLDRSSFCWIICKDCFPGFYHAYIYCVVGIVHCFILHPAPGWLLQVSGMHGSQCFVNQCCLPPLYFTVHLVCSWRSDFPNDLFLIAQFGQCLDIYSRWIHSHTYFWLVFLMSKCTWQVFC